MPARFERFSPQNALDLVTRVPGFQIVGGSTGRGFGQGGSNVLINGQRMSGKSIGVGDVLRRIPVKRVRWLERLEASDLNLPGLSGPVVNVVVRDADLSGTWRYEAGFRDGVGPTLSEFSGSLSGTQAGWAWTASLENRPDRFAEEGIESLRNADRELTETRFENTVSESQRQSTSLLLGRDWGNGMTANLNGQYVRQTEDRLEVSRRRPLVGDGRDRRFPFSLEGWEAEIGGDLEWPVAIGQLKLVGLIRHQEDKTDDTSRDARPDGTPLSDRVLRRDTSAGERIVRTEMIWPGHGERDWQVSLEGAFNFLDRTSSLEEAEAGGVPLLVELDGGSTRVEEVRAESFLTLSDKIVDDVAVQVSLGAEYSQLSQTGASSETRSFVRPKGLLALTYDPGGASALNASVERRVGQLNFGDFVSSVNLDEGDTRLGNPELVPDQTWSINFEWERDLGEQSAATLAVFYDTIEDPISRVPLGDSDEGPGNTESATRYGVSLDTTLALDAVGFAGGLLEFSGNWRDGRFEDPVTLESSRLSNSRLSEYEVSFRQDIFGSAWAWGVGYEIERRTPRLRRDQTRRTSQSPGFGSAFVEHKDVFGLVGRLRVQNILDQEEQTRRTVFTDDRPSPVERFEDSMRSSSPSMSLQLRGTF